MISTTHSGRIAIWLLMLAVALVTACSSPEAATTRQARSTVPSSLPTTAPTPQPPVTAWETPTVSSVAVPAATPVGGMRFTGQGDRTIGPFVLPAEVSVVHFSYAHGGPFVVWFLRGGFKNLLVWTDGPYGGSRPLTGGGKLGLQVEARDAWTANVAPLGRQPSAVKGISGTQDVVSGFFTPPKSGAGTYTFDYAGSRNFAVWIDCHSSSDLVENAFGSLHDTARVEMAEGPCF